jgi:hypothetical protein
MTSFRRYGGALSLVTGDSPRRLPENHRGGRGRRQQKIRDGRYKQLVPRRGLEPPRPFERQILSLVRLPIPPPGLVLHIVATATEPLQTAPEVVEDNHSGLNT